MLWLRFTPEQITQLDEALAGADSKTRLRLQAIKLLAARLSGKQIADVLGVHPNTVYSWIRRYKAEGVGGLSDRPRSGRPPKADEKYLATLQDLMHNVGRRCTAVQLQNEMHSLTGVYVSSAYLRRLLRQLGYTSGWISNQRSAV